ncbi:MAG: hypothetical protein IKB05_03330 [Alphaproteobacteria bacterium]|nr:hypothetical protein [Alphaproteobacteria bacterium]
MRMFGEKLNLVKFLSGVAVAALVSMPAVAAVTCDDDDALINPALALCSTHVYNVGGDKNLSDGADREMMRDVVALKTTVMTQQMYKQYEYLESMIRRFKTQLEKAVLKTRLQTSGAGDDSSGGASGFKSNDRNIFINGVENCNNKLLPTDVLNCLNTNLNTIANLSFNGSEVTREVRKQLANDFGVLNATHTSVSCMPTNSDEATKTAYEKCSGESKIKKKTDFQDCLDKARACIRNKMYDLNLKAQQNNRWQQN